MENDTIVVAASRVPDEVLDSFGSDIREELELDVTHACVDRTARRERSFVLDSANHHLLFLTSGSFVENISVARLGLASRQPCHLLLIPRLTLRLYQTDRISTAYTLSQRDAGLSRPFLAVAGWQTRP